MACLREPVYYRKRPLVTQTAKRHHLRIGALRLVWIVLILLAAFVLFVECIAQVGGRDDPLPRPLSTPPPASSTPTTAVPCADWLVARA